MLWFILEMIGVAAVIGATLPKGDDRKTSIKPDALRALIGQGASILILDVRTLREFNDGHIPGAALMPYDAVLAAPDEIPLNGESTVVVYCEHGPRAWLAQGALIKSGLTDVLHLTGDMEMWRQLRLPVALS
jgi:phage shock protein E